MHNSQTPPRNQPCAIPLPSQSRIPKTIPPKPIPSVPAIFTSGQQRAEPHPIVLRAPTTATHKPAYLPTSTPTQTFSRNPSPNRPSPTDQGGIDTPPSSNRGPVHAPENSSSGTPSSQGHGEIEATKTTLSPQTPYSPFGRQKQRVSPRRFFYGLSKSSEAVR